MRLRAFRLAPLFAAALLLLLPALAAAQDEGERLLATEIAVDSIWVVLAAILVLFMQAGFAMLETGLSRMKNAGAVMAKIFVNLAVALIMFWAIGFGLAFGDGNGFVGATGFGLPTGNVAEDFPGYAESLVPIEGQFMFQVVFAAVSLAIVFGSMLDRTKFQAYVVFGIVYVGLLYPIVAHWTWGGGWLGEDGFLDFAGSSIVHLQGAVAALAGALILGPRIGKFRNGKAIPIPGHSMPLALLGVLILLVGWQGFNGGSSLAAIGANFSDVILNTNLAAGAGVLGAIVGSLIMFRTLDVSQIGNGMIAALVAITAPCAFVDAWAAIVIGVIAGLLVPPLVVGIERLKIDDPVGAVPVHGISGIWGTLAIGFFAVADKTDGVDGIFYGGDGEQLWIQTYGVLATIGFTFVTTAIVFLIIKYTVGLRVSEEQELRGLDMAEHGMFGYPERFIEVPGAEPADLPPEPTPAPASASASSTATT